MLTGFIAFGGNDTLLEDKSNWRETLSHFYCSMAPDTQLCILLIHGFLRIFSLYFLKVLPQWDSGTLLEYNACSHILLATSLFFMLPAVLSMLTLSGQLVDVPLTVTLLPTW